jgi:protein SCO1/2
VTSATPTSQRILLGVLVALLAAIGAILLGRNAPHGGSPSPTSFAGPAMPPGLHAADFALTDQGGHLVTLSRYRGRVVVLTFIHSRCKDACPFMVEQIKGALNEIPDSGRAVVAIGISVVPAEDTRASRRAFLAQHEMSGRMAFLNGAPPALARVWHAYAIQPVQGNVDHSTFVLLIDKHGIERVGFPADQLTPEGLAHDIGRLQRERA